MPYTQRRQFAVDSVFESEHEYYPLMMKGQASETNEYLKRVYEIGKTELDQERAMSIEPKPEPKYTLLPLHKVKEIPGDVIDLINNDIMDGNNVIEELGLL